MAANLWKVASANAFNTTLNGNIGAGDATITLTSVTNLNATGGVLCIDRQDANSNDTPVLREYISYTGISGNNLTGCTRGLGGSTAQAHISSAKVEECFSVSHWNDLITAILNVLTITGAVDTTKVVDLSSSQTLTNKTLTAPVIATISNSGTLTLPASADTLVGRATTDTLTNKTLTKPTLNATIGAYTSDVDGSTITFDMSASNIHNVTLGGNRTLAVSNVSTGQAFVIILKQDGTGTRTVTWWAGIKWSGGSAPTLTATASNWDIFSFIYDGTNYFGSIAGQAYA